MPHTLSRLSRLPQELAELQKRFNALSDQQRATEASSSLLLATRKAAKSSKSIRVSDSTASLDGASTKQLDATGVPPEEELKRLDEQIVSLRRKHDKLHEKNQMKRSELDVLADKLKDLHNTRFNPRETPEGRLDAMEGRLNECAARYDEEHRLKMSYEQVINRLKKEQLEWPAEVKHLETLLGGKETDYEQLLVMSHDANSSKESAKVELSKFESLVLDERKSRERELQERRQVLQKKQQLAAELDRSERERRATLQDQQRSAGEDQVKIEAQKMEALIKEEHAKIAAYEAAFQQIKEATGVSDVNEVIQRFLLQEETHQNLLHMTSESQNRIAELQQAVDVEKTQVMNAEYSAANGDAEAAGAQETDSAQTHAAQKALNKQRERWVKVAKILVNTKSATQHIVDVLEPLREKDEVVAPMSDDTLLQHLEFAESKLGLISSAFYEMDAEHKVLLSSISQPAPAKSSSAKKEAFNVSAFDRSADKDNDSEEEFEEDLEEDVMDRSALKKQSTSIVDKGAKKKKKMGGKRRSKGDD